ncbi:hypothetical protein SAMN05428995_10392 [Loktanella sp. DSM 29012]|uniref:hypothetical protein n=1 Tax=Loktanella sp. DSM 29012 TaxID=1881056 RepID=UPI0008B7FE76|nr:hypothetical protein [Loktanella sp. DSM 29012]SEQ16745.1 hypothetical protein SAMN05428995_10392 [Loktanella sp. DSM 29012]
MIIKDDPEGHGRAAALSRQHEIAGLYATLRAAILKEIKTLGASDGAPPKLLIGKIGELSAAHLILLKAEEAFREKYAQDDATILDYDTLRVEIGCALDRIRASLATEGVSDGAE